jgi:hypothetical protein
VALGTREFAQIWAFGKTSAGVSNSLGSTGAGAAVNTYDLGLQFTFIVEADGGATCSYQIRTGRSAAGPFAVLSSGTLSTGAADVVQIPGPLGFISPRIKTLNSTANLVVVRGTAI